MNQAALGARDTVIFDFGGVITSSPFEALADVALADVAQGAGHGCWNCPSRPGDAVVATAGSALYAACK